MGETAVGERVAADALAVTLPKVTLGNTVDGLPLSSVANILGDVFSAKKVIDETMTLPAVMLTMVTSEVDTPAAEAMAPLKFW